jgi:hypothetical protein
MVEEKCAKSFQEQLLGAAIELAHGGDIGSLYASRFEDALDDLIEQGKIISWRATERHSAEDREGYDYWLQTEQGDVPFSITSDKRKAQVRRKKLPDTTVAIRKRGKRELKSVEMLDGEIMRRVDKYLSAKRLVGR